MSTTTQGSSRVMFAQGERRSPAGTAAVWEYERPHHALPGRSWWRRIGVHRGPSDTPKRHAFEDWIVARYWTVLR